MFDFQSGIRMFASVTSVILLSYTVSGDERPFSARPAPSLPLPAVNTYDRVAVQSDVPVERESRIFSSSPVKAARPPAPVTQPQLPVAAPPANNKYVAVNTTPQTAPPDVPPAAAVDAAPVTAMAPIELPNTQLMEQYYSPPLQSVPNYCQNQQLPHHWFSAESLIWWTSQPDVPVIATTSTQGTPGLQAGILGQPQTGTLWGGGDLFDLTRGGVRLRAGRWSDDNDGSGIQAEFLMLGSAGHNFFGQSNGNPILARPFVNQETGFADAQLIGFPGLSTGSLAFNAETRMYSVGFNYWAELIAEYDDGCGEVGCGSSCGSSCGSGCRSSSSCQQTDSVFGFKIGPRFIHHDDTILANETLTGLASGNQFSILDSFKTENSFLGGEIGLRAQRNKGIYSMDLGLNLGIGATRQELDVSGLTTITTPAGVRTSTPGGFLAQSTNSGSWDETKFSLVPSLEFKLGMEAGHGWRVAVGYDFMYWTNVLRASEQIDTVIHPGLFPAAVPGNAATRPGVVLNESDYFAHGISLSIERRW